MVRGEAMVRFLGRGEAGVCCTYRGIVTRARDGVCPSGLRRLLLVGCRRRRRCVGRVGGWG